MSVGQKLTMLKIRSTRVTFLSLSNLEAAPEEAMQLRRLIKSSNESLGPYLFWKIEFWNFLGPTAEIPGGGSGQTPPRRGQYLKKPAWNRVNRALQAAVTRRQAAIQILYPKYQNTDRNILDDFY